MTDDRGPMGALVETLDAASDLAADVGVAYWREVCNAWLDDLVIGNAAAYDLTDAYLCAQSLAAVTNVARRRA